MKEVYLHKDVFNLKSDKKKYKRITDKNWKEHYDIFEECFDCKKDCNQCKKNFKALVSFAELEDQLESNQICDREEVRKETVREILKSMLNKMYKLTGCGVPYHVKKFIEEIAMEYGVKLEDEE